MKYPAADVVAAVKALTSAMQRREPPFESLSLGVDMRDLKMPIEGQLRVPVRIQTQPADAPSTCRVLIGAAAESEFFPRFEGRLTVAPVERSGASLCLCGRYDAPLGFLGGAVDASVLRGVAERSLREFLAALAVRVNELIEETERTRLQMARLAHH